MKNIDYAKLYQALKAADLPGDFSAFTLFDGKLQDVETFPSLPYEAIVFFKWIEDAKNYVEINASHDDYIAILLKEDDYFLPYEYCNNQITIQKGFYCPEDLREKVGRVLEELTIALNNSVITPKA